MRKRRTARVYLFDPVGRVLLIRFAVPRPEGMFEFWLTPGGEIEGVETPAEAAVREIREELGLEIVVEGPVYDEANQFLHEGEMRDNLDYYFVASCPASAPVLAGLTPQEISLMQEIRWWSVAELEAATSGEMPRHRIFPVDVVDRVRGLLAERVRTGPPSR